MLSIKRIPFSIRSLLADVSNQYEILAIEKNISFEAFINPDAPDELIGDPQRIKQILQNLCSNAIKFTMRGGIQVSLQIKQTEQKDKFKLSICVQDTGIGIRKKMQHKLFKPFEQIESEDNRHFEGSGLGLSITRQLCDLMNATIEFESELNKGTKASVVMQLDLSKAFLIDNDKDPTLSSPLSILLFGSDIAELKRRASALAKKGLTIFIQNSQQAAISHLSQHHVDILLTSLFDQQIDSPEFINVARKNSKNQRIKIIITSNYAEVEARALLKPSEVDAILSLPTSLFHITNGLLTEQALDNNVEQKQLDILLVEDNLLNQELMLNMLMRCSKDISVANNGKECLEVLNKKQSFDIILMDIQMPVMDGVEAMREIRKNKTISQIPVIAVTANALSDDVETYLNAGFAKHISKPFSSEQLINSIYSLVRK
jgi:CheY-like chemotaxis protein/anti-sigma regulatory factor (Ser/Thr protein kinase)